MKGKNENLHAWVRIALLLGVSSICFAENVIPPTPIDGEWFVGVQDLEGGARQIGTLLISGFIYRYLPSADAEVPGWMSDRFAFINAETGRVEYKLRVSPDGQLDNLDDHTTFAELSFSGKDEVFLVRIDQDLDQLYFHAKIGEIQMYEISKGFGDDSTEQ